MKLTRLFQFDPVLQRFKALGCVCLASLIGAGTAAAHDPDRKNQPVTPIIDVIGPLGNNLKPGHRRGYNRPSYIEGKIAYHLAPSSQEAMSWHRAVHSGAYKDPKKCLRLEQHFFYPKPWQVLTVGPRRSRVAPSDTPAGASGPSTAIYSTPAIDSAAPDGLDLETPELIPPKSQPEIKPGQEVEIELPELKLQDPLKSSDLPKADSAAARLHRAVIRTVSGNSDESTVSQASVSREKVAGTIRRAVRFFHPTK